MMKLLAKFLLSKYTGKLGNKAVWEFVECVVKHTSTKKDDKALAFVKKHLGV